MTLFRESLDHVKGKQITWILFFIYQTKGMKCKLANKWQILTLKFWIFKVVYSKYISYGHAQMFSNLKKDIWNKKSFFRIILQPKAPNPDPIGLGKVNTYYIMVNKLYFQELFQCQGSMIIPHSHCIVETKDTLVRIHFSFWSYCVQQVYLCFNHKKYLQFWRIPCLGTRGERGVLKGIFCLHLTPASVHYLRN